MVEVLINRHCESAAHLRLKRAAALWAQRHGYRACALEVRLPRCRYRADLAAYRPDKSGGLSAVFECKQTWADLRRDNCSAAAARERLDIVQRRRELLEKRLRVHYPQARLPDSLFEEFASHDFSTLHHRGYTRVRREIVALQNRLHDCTKFEKLVRYRCANLFYLVLPNELYRETEVPLGWGALVERSGGLELVHAATLHPIEDHGPFLQQIAAAATRGLNRDLGITTLDVFGARPRWTGR